jgi:hypothetical protein
MSELLPIHDPPSVPQCPSASVPSTTWLSVTAAAMLMNISERRIQQLCGEDWLAQGKARTVRQEGLKPAWEVRSDADPALGSPISRLASPSSPTVTLDANAFKSFPAKARNIALARAAMLTAWERYLAAGETMNLSRDDATDRFLQTLANPQLPIPNYQLPIPSRSTLYVWAARQKEDGILGLIPGWSKREKESTLAKAEDPFLEAVKRYYLDQRKRSIKICHALAMQYADDHGCSYRSYDMSKRTVKSIPPELVSLLRFGDKHFEDNHAPYINTTRVPLESGELWDADHHTCDVIVQVGTRLNAETGKLVPIYKRPTLTAWQDMRSAKIVGHVIRAEDPDTDVIIEALDLAMEKTNLIPWGAYTDNGKDFDAFELTGITKKMRWHRRKLRIRHDQNTLGGLYAAFKIDHIHALPYHGQSKPIERFFRRFEEEFGKMWATYCGRNPQEKPEDLPAQLARGNAPMLEEFTAAFEDWLEFSYHAEPHRGEGMDGKSPNAVWEENLKTIRACPQELRRILMQKKIGRWESAKEKGKPREFKPLTVDQNGVVHQGIWYGQYALASYHGREVFLRLDRQDITRVAVYGVDDTFICWAPSNHQLPRNATHAQQTAAIKEKNRAIKAMKESAKMRPRIHEDLVDIMLRAAQKRKALSVQTPNDNPPPVYQAIRSDLEAQLPAIRQNMPFVAPPAISSGESHEDIAPLPFKYPPSPFGGAAVEDEEPTHGCGFTYQPREVAS